MAFTKITSTNIAANTVASYAEFANFASALAPKITSIAITSNTYSVLDDAAVNVGGGFIVVTGSNFQSGATILIDTVSASAVTYVNDTTLRAQVPARSAASYNLYVVNPDGGTGIKVAGITYSGTPTWVTASPLANVSSNTVFSNTFNATGATSYANTTILPTGFNLLANGYYFGNISIGESQTTYSFNIRATDAELQDSDKTFSLTAVNVPPTYSADYLVVAGGGGGSGAALNGFTQGGAGAGGLSQGLTTLTRGQTYNITVGGGGASGVSGTSSNIANPSPSFTNINIPGGGFSGQAGGSGGGGLGGWNIVSNGLATGSPGNGIAGTFGWPGGLGAGPAGGDGFPGGGGGGGGASGPGTASTLGGNGGNGGPGYLWPITGTTYAGGGGGGSPRSAPTGVVGNGGTGGGGAGGKASAATAGTVNTGGGGGGAGQINSPTAPPTPNFQLSGGVGGSGVVILAVPTPQYPGSAPGATVTTPPAAPGKTVLTYNSSGTYTA